MSITFWGCAIFSIILSMHGEKVGAFIFLILAVWIFVDSKLNPVKDKFRILAEWVRDHHIKKEGSSYTIDDNSIIIDGDEFLEKFKEIARNC